MWFSTLYVFSSYLATSKSMKANVLRMFWSLFQWKHTQRIWGKNTHRRVIRAGSLSAILPCFNPLQSAENPAHEHADGHGSGSDRSEPPLIAVSPVTWNTSSTKLTARAGCGIFTRGHRKLRKSWRNRSVKVLIPHEYGRWRCSWQVRVNWISFSRWISWVKVQISAPQHSLHLWETFFPARWNQSSIPRRALLWAETAEDCRRPQREGFWVL